MSTITLGTTVSDAELAALAGVSARRIRQMIEAGDLERVGRGRLALGASIKAMIELAAGNGSALQRERTRAIKAQADMRELELLRARGEVALISEFHAVQAHTATLIRTNLMNVRTRAVLQLLNENDETRFKQVLRAEIVLALQQAKAAIESRTADEIPNQEETQDE